MLPRSNPILARPFRPSHDRFPDKRGVGFGANRPWDSARRMACASHAVVGCRECCLTCRGGLPGVLPDIPLPSTASTTDGVSRIVNGWRISRIVCHGSYVTDRISRIVYHGSYITDRISRIVYHGSYITDRISRNRRHIGPRDGRPHIPRGPASHTAVDGLICRPCGSCGRSLTRRVRL